MAFYRWHGGGQISKTRWKQVPDALRCGATSSPYLRAGRPSARRRLAELTDGYLLREAYRAYWRRDLDDAVLLRAALREGAWRLRDLGHILPAPLPAPLFRRLVGLRGAGMSPLQVFRRAALAPEHTAAQSGERRMRRLRRRPFT